MSNPITSIEIYLFHYTQLILEFEDVLKNNFKLPDHPWQCLKMFPRRGVVTEGPDSYSYHFHGRGCSFDYNGLEVHYDYVITEPNYLTTVPWKFWRFVTTFAKREGRQELSEIQIAEALEALSGKGPIVKIDPQFPNYQINFQWILSF